MFCQRCGKRNETDREKCRFCGAPLLLISPDRSSENSNLQPFLGVEDYLIDKLSTVEKQAHQHTEEVDLLVHAMDYLERNAMVNRAGINVLVTMLREKGLIASREFNLRWRARTLSNLSALYRKERFLDARPDILAGFKGKNRRRFEERISRAEDMLYGLQSKEALDLLEQALALAPDNEPLLAYIGELALSLGSLDRAEACLSKISALKPPPPNAVVACVQLKIRRFRPSEAEQILEAALNRDPESGDLWVLLAIAKAMQKDWRQCKRCAERAIGIEERPVAVYLLAHALIQQGKISQADKRLEELQTAYPDWEPALLQRAMIFLGRGWWSRAGEILDHLESLDPGEDTEDLVERFKRADRSKRKGLVAVPMDPMAMLDLMDPASEEAGIYLRQMES